MGVVDDLVKSDKNDIFKYVGWIEWIHISSKLIHCPVCLNLNGCWFNDMKKPMLPQHERCHCLAITISNPMPNVDAFAKCDIEKFTNYIFSDKYAWNGKRKLFELMGFSVNDSQYLQEEYEKQAINNYCSSNYKLGKLNAYGQRVDIDIAFERNGKRVVFTSGWMVKPRGLIVNNTPLGG